MSDDQLLEIAVTAYWDAEGNTRDALIAVVAALKEALTARAEGQS